MEGGVYRKSKGNAGLEGVQFQLDLLIVFLSNALRNHKDWRISSENQEAGKYDDLVIELTDRSVFLQSKFKQTRKVTRDQLFSCNSKTADFSLPKYFFSYLEIKSEFKEKIVMICTNAEVNPKGLENVLVHHDAEGDSLLHCEGATCSFFTLNENVLHDLKANAEIYFDKNLQGKTMDKAVITDKNMKEFLKNFQFFYNYPSGNELHKMIQQLLSQLGDLWCRTSYHEIYRKVEDWFKQPKGEYLTELRSIAMLCEIRSDKYCESLKDFNLLFDSNDLDIGKFRGITIIKIKEGYLLQILKIYSVLQGDKNRKLYVNPDDAVEVQKQTVEAFGLHCYTFLIMAWAAIGDETAKREIINKVRKILESNKYKKVILVVDSSADLAQRFGLDDICQIDGSVTFQDLSKEAQKKLLNAKNVLFQGEAIKLGELLHTEADEDYTKSLDSAMLEGLIRGKEIKVGVRPLDLDEDTARYYISRKFQIQTNDKTRDVRNVLTERDLYDIKEKMIAIQDSAGMGKSTALANMAVTIKKTFPSLWVIKINLYDYTKVLRDSLKAERHEISAAELLNSQEATMMTNEFEKLVFSISGKVVLMLDGVDEISPDYTDLVLNLLNHCKEAPNFAKIFVTTRPHVDLTPEGIKLFYMLPLTRLEQEHFLTDYWMHNLQLSQESRAKCKQYVEILINKVALWTRSSHYQQNLFTDVPLQVKMLAEIFQQNIKGRESADWEGCKEYVKGRQTNPKLPEKFNIAELYDSFIEKKRDVFVEKGTSSGSVTTTPALLNQFESCLAHHRTLAVSTILPIFQSLFMTRTVESDDMKEYILKIGIVQRLGDSLQFIHRTFAEYFLADSIVRELKLQNPNAKFQWLLIDNILRNDELEIVRAFLDIFLQRVSLPPNVFRQYQSVKYEKSNPSLVFQLAEGGYVAILQLILESVHFKVIEGRIVDVRDWRLRIPFRKRNTLNDLGFLIRQAGVNIKSKRSITPLHAAVKAGHLEMVDFLVEQGADVNMKDWKSQTALHLAINSKNYDIVKSLVEHRADVNIRNDKGYPILHAAVSQGASDIVAYLLEHGTDINAKDGKNDTALHLAIEKRNWNMGKYLVEHGADVNLQDGSGFTPLRRASVLDALYIVVCLVDHGADVNVKDRNENTALHMATFRRNWDIIKYLVEHGADVNARGEAGLTPLHVGAKLVSADIVEYLLEHGADPNAKDITERSALHYATSGKHLKIVRYLVEHGADVNTKDNERCTALHYAVRCCDLSIVRYLADHGADVTHRNWEGCTALHFAVNLNKMNFIEDLLQHGANVNAKDNENNTALHMAIYNQSLNIGKYLVEHGADVNARNDKGFTALHVAAKFNRADIVEYLLEHGTEVDVIDDQIRTTFDQ